MSVSWEEIHEEWDQAAEAADQALTQSAVRLRRMWPFSLRRLTVPIALTGHRGSGKSLLYDALLGQVGTDYVPPGKSQDVEPHKVVLTYGRNKTRCGVVVVPGQESPMRSDALDGMFAEGAFPTGVIHTVCFGHNKIWHSSDRAVVGAELRAGTDTWNAGVVQARDLTQELKDFEELCNRLRDAWTGRSRVWLIIAVAKCDLYWPRLSEARDYYLPDGGTDNGFRTALRGLVEHIGYGNFSGLAVLPVSCYPEAHEFDPTLPKLTPGLDMRQATALVNHFRTVLGDFCERQ